MANPQLEDGHTRIANELLDKLIRLHLSPNQWQILFFVIRKTYGYRKKVDYISNTQIVHGTGIHKAHVSRAMSNLVGRKVLIREGKLVGLQKDYESWLELPELVTKVTQTGNNSPPKKLPVLQQKLPKRTSKVTSALVTQKKKENIQKKEKKIYKRKYGEFQNVLLTDEEYQWLKEKLQDKTDEYIERLSAYLESTGKDKYKSHYATILNWYRRDKEKGEKSKSRRLPNKEEYEPTPEYND